MPEYTVVIETTATAWVRVQVPAEATREEIMTRALNDEDALPVLCIGCTGGGGASWDELELCDWRPFRNHRGKWEIERVD